MELNRLIFMLERVHLDTIVEVVIVASDYSIGRYDTHTPVSRRADISLRIKAESSLDSKTISYWGDLASLALDTYMAGISPASGYVSVEGCMCATYTEEFLDNTPAAELNIV